MLQASGVSDKGSVRPTNQDRFAIDRAHRVCVVADGLGGHHAGELAASLAVEALLQVIRDQRRMGWPFGIDPSLSEAGNLIRTAIHLANLRIIEMAGTSSAYAGMGTTIVVALVADGRLSVGHVGDSRLYRLTGGRLRQMTGDDSWVAAAMATDPRADASLLRHHPMRHVLTDAVGRVRRADIRIVEEPLTPGDRLLLTTDGVHGVLDDGRLERMLTASDDVDAVAAEIVQAALASGSRDNCTAVVARYAA